MPNPKNCQNLSEVRADDRVKPSILRAEFKDASTLLTLQKLAYKTEAERYNNFCIEPLMETLEQTQSDLKQKTVLKAVVGDEIIGSVRGYEVEGTCYIGRLFVDPNFRGKSIGKALMSTIETYFPGAQRFELFTGWKSRSNINMYMGLGYFPFKIEPIDHQAKLVFMEKMIENKLQKQLEPNAATPSEKLGIITAFKK